jgi:pyruvate dehydrogenase E1 component alpha subunit
MYYPLNTGEALDIYRDLIRIRLATETIQKEYPGNEIRTPVHLGTFLEGISVGVVRSCPPQPKTIYWGQLRNHGLYLTVTRETRKFFAELYGKRTGTGSGKAGSMHLCSPEHGLIATSGIVAGTISPAVGAGFASKYLGSGELSVVLIGDAAVEEGEFDESLNFACLHKLPVLFICEDNDLSIHVFAEERRGFTSIANKARAYDCHVFEGDGTDVLEVMEVTQKAIARMTEYPKPAFICFKWFRYLEHVGPYLDFHGGYRPQPSDEKLKASDPVFKYEQFMLGQGVGLAELQEIRDQIGAQIAESVAQAKRDPYPTEGDLLKGVYA